MTTEIRNSHVCDLCDDENCDWQITSEGPFYHKACIKAHISDYGHSNREYRALQNTLAYGQPINPKLT